jgi:iron complex transport system ATP-binding protein
MTSRLATDQMTLAYGEELVIPALSVEIPDGAITTIIGPNGCGKSTLLRGLARLRPLRSGAVLLDGQEIHHWSTIDVARRLGLLGQQPSAPEGITVEELVHRGRYPHQSFFHPPSPQDSAAVERAMALAGVQSLRRRPVDQLSGGQRQRAWIAMALAQDPDVLLLDEPTSFLDVAHQIEVLDLLTELNRTRGTTVVMVLHDLNLAARYADHLIVMAAGRIVTSGPPDAVVRAETVRAAFGLEARVVADPVCGAPMVVPVGRFHRPAPATDRP